MNGFAVALDAIAPGSPVEVVITPSLAEHRQLVRDLEALREAGAPSNTKAILEAVAEAAYAVRADKEPRQRQDAPGPDTGR